MNEVKSINYPLIWKWVANISVPLIAYFLLRSSDAFTPAQAAFLASTLWAVSAWMLGTINEVAVGIILPGLYVFFCEGVTMQTVYEPWRGNIWIVCVGGFILGKITVDSGIGKRIAMTSAKLMGGSFAGALLGLTLAAIIISPFFPAILGQAAIFSAIGIALCDSLGFKPRSREATAVMLAACLAISSARFQWLTGAGGVFEGMSLVMQTMGQQTTWLQYAMYNCPPAIIYTLMSLGIVLLVLRTKGSDADIKAFVAKAHGELGPMTLQEKKALGLIILTVFLLATDQFHGINVGLVLIAITGLAFVPWVGLMDGKRLSEINFAPIFFIMGCMAIGTVGGALKVNQILASELMPLLNHANTLWATLSAYVVGVTINFLLTPLAALFTITAPLTELGMQMGIDPRILFFGFQYGLDNLLFPYEFVLFLYFFGTGYINFKDMVVVMAIRMVATAAFIACIAYPYWSIFLG